MGVVCALAACGGGATQETLPSGNAVQLTFTAKENADGVCGPARVARVNKEATGLDALYGDIAFVDVRDGSATRLPLQLIFRGWDDAGVSKDRVQTGLNTDTPCDQLRIDMEVDYCFHGATRPERTACPPLRIEAEGFAGAQLQADNSEKLPPGR
ncbi:MAG: hypothetical protein ACX94A_03255 [Algiphilus sp.]